MSLVCLDSWLIGQVARVGTTDEIREDGCGLGRAIVISLVFNHSYHWNVAEVLGLLNSTPGPCIQPLREYLERFCEPYELHSHIYMSEVEYHLRRIFTASTRTLGQLHTNK